MMPITKTPNQPSNNPIYTLVITWALLFPLLVFGTGYGFSFELGALNTNAGATFAAQGISGMGLAKSPVLRIQTLVVYLVCAFLLVPYTRIIATEFRRNMLIASLPLLAVLSCIWSQNALKSLGYAILLTAGIAFAFYLLARFPPNRLMKLFVTVGTIAALGSLFLVVFLPQYGLTNRARIASGAWQGIFMHKNNCGEAMTYLLLAAFFVQFKSRYAKMFRIVYIVVVLLIIVMSQSAGAWVICGSCLVLIATMKLLVRMPRKDVAVIALLLLGIGVIAGIGVYKYFDLLMLALGKDATMTGRTIIWSGLLPSIMKRPFLGYGFMAFWQGLHGESANVGLLVNWPGIGYAENGVIELWLELGALGVVLYLLMFLRAVKNGIYCFTREPSSAVMWYCSLLFVLLISNIEGGTLLSPTDLKFLLPMIAVIGLRREAQHLRGQRVS